jgi:hypothetical protein
MSDVPRLSALEVYKAESPSKWVEERYYNARMAELRTMETQWAQADGRAHVLELTNTRLAQELGELRTPKRELAIHPGRCTCTIKTTTMRCDYCGKEA